MGAGARLVAGAFGEVIVICPQTQALRWRPVRLSRMSVGLQVATSKRLPPVGQIPRLYRVPLPQLRADPPNTLVAAAMDERGGGGGVAAERWPWWAAASAAQAAAGVAWFRRGKGGTAVAMPFKAFAIASLFVGAGATAAAAGVLAAGVGSVRRRRRHSAPAR